MSKTSEINFTVQLDDNKMPAKIEWEATDADFTGKKECSALLISLWDKNDKATLGIDLWTKEMLVHDMNIHVHQVLLKLADTCMRATNNPQAGNMIKDFANEYAEKLNLLEEGKTKG